MVKNKFLKNIASKIAILCMGTTLFSGIIMPVSAHADEVTTGIPKDIVVHKEGPFDYSPLLSPLDGKTKVRYIDTLVDNTGEEVFCLQHGLNPPNNNKYDNPTKLDAGVNWIIKNYYTNKEFLTNYKNLNYYITYKAIHVYLGQENFKIKGKTALDPKHILPLINKIVAKAKEVKNDNIGKIDAKIYLKSEGDKYNFENNKFVSPTYIVEKTGNGTVEKVNLSVSNNKAKIFVNGKETSNVKVGEKFNIEIPVNEVKANENIKVNANATIDDKYDYAMAYSPIGTNNVQKVAKYVKGIVNTENLNAEATSKVSGIGRIQITKVDEETGAKLEGAKFELIDKATGKVLQTLTTDKQGEAISNWYPVGTEVIVKEVTAPNKYILNGQEYTATITENMQTIKVTVPDKIMKGRIQITKVDEETGAKLEGAKFELIDKATGKVLQTLTTDKQGEAISNWYPVGTEVIVKEVTAPNKYILNGQEYTATITENIQTIDIKVPNRIIKGTISIHKIDQETKKPLAGVEFNILNSDNKVIETIKTDKDGNAKTTELNYGKYKVIEVKTNKYYNLNKKAIDVNITENKNYNYTVENAPITGKLVIKKVDLATGKEVEGAKIKITCIDGVDKGKVIEFVSGKTATEFNLKAGKYTYEEITAPAGYELNKEVGQFEITTQGQVVKCEIKDKAIEKPVLKVELPHTGYSYDTIAVIVAGIIIVIGVIIALKKNNKK